MRHILAEVRKWVLVYLQQLVTQKIYPTIPASSDKQNYKITKERLEYVWEFLIDDCMKEFELITTHFF